MWLKSILPAAAFLGAVAIPPSLWAQASPPAASGPSDAVKAMVGSWEFSNADRDRRCTVTFRTDPAGVHGMKLDFDKSCATTFGFTKDVVAWTLAEHDFLRFVDAKGKALLEFSEVEQGIFEAPKPGEGILFLQTSASVGAPPKTAEEMTGRWAVMRNGRTLCGVTLATAPAQDGFALTLEPGCDGLVTRFAPSFWQMDRGELVLTGAHNQTWRFEQDEPKTWQRVPETRDPIQMVKQ